MKDKHKTKEQLINELVKLRSRITELKKSETKFKQAEETLRKAKQERTAILNSMSEHVVFQDLEHRVMWANRAAGESVGLAPEQLVGRYCYEIWPKRNKPCVGCPVAKAGETGQPQEAEVTTPNGRVWFIRGYPLKDANGNVAAVVEVTLEITQHKQAEEALRKSEARFAGIVDAIRDHMSMMDEQHNIVWANDVAKQLFGPDLVGKKCYTAYHRRNKVCEPCIVKKTLADVRSHEHETEVIGADGRQMNFWCKSSVAAWYPDGRPKWVIEISRDITQRKQAEEELRKYREHLEGLVKERTAELTAANEQLQQGITQRKQAEETLRKTEQEKRAILNSMSELVVYQDREMRILWANKAAGKSVGLTPEQLVGRHCYEIWHKRSKPCVGCPVIKAWKTGQMHKAEMTTPEGSVGFVRAYPLRDGNGKVLGVVEVVQDITERKQAEEALQESDQKLTAMLGSIGDHMSMLDKDLNIIWANEAAKKIFGEDIIGKKCYSVYHRRKEPCEPYPCHTLKAFQDGKIHEIETQAICKDGRIAYFHSTANVALKDKEGKPTAVIEVARDITGQKKAEEALKVSLKEKETLLQEIHHRVKNNMQLIYSLINLQSQYIQDKMSIEILKDIQNRIRSMYLIHEKLYQSKDLANIDFNKYIPDLVNTLYQAYRVDRGKIKPEVNVKDVSLGIDFAIPCGLIINELVSNSLKYAFPKDREGKIKVTLCPIDKNHIELVVSDNGIGIPKDLNFRETESLGLRLVTILAEDQLKGEIELDRKRGTKFKIKFGGPI